MEQSSEEFQQFISAKVLVVAQQLATRQGFFEYWFKVLPACSSHKRAFDLTNLLYQLIFKEEKYASFNSFQSQKTRYLKTLKK